LRTLLEASGESGPFVIVGHGLGAAFARMYAARADAHAAAVVLINPPAEGAGHPPTSTWLMPASPWLARVGVLRAGRILSSRADALDGSSGAAVRAFLNRPDHLTRAAAEVAKWNDAVRMAAGSALPADLPATRVQVSDGDRIAFLSNPADVERVVEAIDEAITTSRGRSAAP
jgi:pimeloyl-ACP methyl ester carboxylesterase